MKRGERVVGKHRSAGRRAGIGLVAAALLISAAPAQVLALTPDDGGAITVWPFPVSPASGANADPHVDGIHVSYTSGGRIHRFEAFFHSDVVIPGPAGTQDQLSDTSDERVTFARSGPGGTAIMLYDWASDTTTEIDPQPSPARTAPAIGSDTVAFIDLGASPEGELFATRLTGSTTRVTTDTRTDRNPAVAPSGGLIVYESCGASCDIHQAAWNGSGWVVTTLAGTPDPEADPDTDGSVVVYDAVRSGDRDIFWQPVGGGAEQRVALPGEQRNPAVIGGYVTFESLAPGASSWDIEAYDIATNRLFLVAGTPANELASDVTLVSADRLRVLWVVGDGALRDVIAADFGIPPVGSRIVTPVDGGAFGMLLFPINTAPGEQLDPHVDGDTATYTAFDGSSVRVRSYDFFSGADAPIATSSGAADQLSDLDGDRIVFTRDNASAGFSNLLYDVSAGTTTPIDPSGAGHQLDPAIGGDTIAWLDVATLPTRLLVARSGGAPVNLAAGGGEVNSANVARNGDLVVYSSCQQTPDCEIRQAAWNGAAWVLSVLASGTAATSVDTDGSVVAYTATRNDQTDLYWQPVGGGVERRLSLPGQEMAASVSAGVISFVSVGQFNGTGDLYLYEIVTNRLFRITSTPWWERLSDVDVLQDGRIRLVWDAGDYGERDVYGATLELPPVGPTYHFGGFASPVDDLPTLNQMKAGGAVPVKFSLGGSFGMSIFAGGYPRSETVSCLSSAPVDGVEQTVTAGASGLTYDAASGLYTYVWKTDKAWAGTCRQLVLAFMDGTTARANFKFK
jgi:hypothetical protein